MLPAIVCNMDVSLCCCVVVLLCASDCCFCFLLQPEQMLFVLFCVRAAASDLGHGHRCDPRPIWGTGTSAARGTGRVSGGGTGAGAAPRRTAGEGGREGARGASRRDQVLVKVLVQALAQAAVALAQALAPTKSRNWSSTGAIRRCGSGAIPSAPSLGTGRRPFWERQGTIPGRASAPLSGHSNVYGCCCAVAFEVTLIKLIP